SPARIPCPAISGATSRRWRRPGWPGAVSGDSSELFGRAVMLPLHEQFPTELPRLAPDNYRESSPTSLQGGADPTGDETTRITRKPTQTLRRAGMEHSR